MTDFGCIQNYGLLPCITEGERALTNMALLTDGKYNRTRRQSSKNKKPRVKPVKENLFQNLYHALVVSKSLNYSELQSVGNFILGQQYLQERIVYQFCLG